MDQQVCKTGTTIQLNFPVSDRTYLTSLLLTCINLKLSNKIPLIIKFFMKGNSFLVNPTSEGTGFESP